MTIMNLAWSNSGNHKKTDDDNYDVVLLDCDVDKDEIEKWKNKGKIVIGYISAGSLENWRSDKNDFSDRVVGDSMDGWDGEKVVQS